MEKQNDTDNADSDVCDISGLSDHSSDCDFAVTKKMLVEKYMDDDKEFTRRIVNRYGGNVSTYSYSFSNFSKEK